MSSKKNTSALKRNEKQMLKKLAELGGNMANEDSLVYEGSRLVLPETMTAMEAIEVIDRHIRSQEAETSFDKVFKYRPWDGANALQATLKKLFGYSGIGVGQAGFFGSTPPQMKTINVGVDETTQIPWGELELPTLKATIMLGGSVHPEYGVLFHVQVTCPRKYRGHIEGLFKAVADELETNSIYKGKAVDGQDMPEFVDLRGVDPEKVVYSADVSQQLEANIWSMLRHTDKMEELEIPLKRAVLLHGPFGTGKTLAAFLTAQIAVENGWTFVMCRPGKDNLDEVMQTARLYQPAVVFFEDVDTLANNGEIDNVTQLLDLFDGINAKGTKLMAVMTTNHVDRIHKGMVRPGRLDAVIEIANLDLPGVEKLVRTTVGEEMLSGSIDYERIAEAMEGFQPAFVKEAIDRTLRYAVARNNGNTPKKLDTEDFIAAANGLRPQLDIMHNAGEGKQPDPLGMALQKTVSEAFAGSRVVDPELNLDAEVRVGEESKATSL